MISNENQSCRGHEDLQLLFWSSCHLTKFEPFKFEILKMTSSNQNLRPKMIST